MLFSLAVIFLVGLSAAAIFQTIGLPRIIGMLATGILTRSEEHTSELQSHNAISYAVFCLKKIFF